MNTPERRAGQPYPHSKDYRTKKRDIVGAVGVSGEIKANLPPALLDEYKASNEATDRRESKRFRLEKATFISVLAVFVLSLIQTDRIIKSTKATESAADTAKQTLLVTQRAYLSSGEPEEILGGRAVIRVPIDNEGNIAATRASLRINFERMTVEGKVLEDRVMEVPLPEEIPSGKRSAFLVISMPNMGPDTNAAISSGKQHLVVRGHLRYDSGFDRFRVYNLVFGYKPREKRWVNSSGTSIDIWLEDAPRRDVSSLPKP